MIEAPTRIEADLTQPKDRGARVEMALADYGVRAKTRHIVAGPTITRYELSLRSSDSMPRMSRIASLRPDLAYKLAAKDVRILAPIPGQDAIGIEVPAANPRTITFSEMLDAVELSHPLDVILGVTIDGQPLTVNLARFPHALIAGSTGSGKSSALHTIICSLLYRDERAVDLVLVDPKLVELSRYASLPRTKVITNAYAALDTFDDLTDEMDRRYKVMAAAGARDITEYDGDMPYIVVVVDELADLIMAAKKEAEAAICRLAQKSRAVGIHLLLATQSPRHTVITGMLKTNCPSRIAFAVPSMVDSRVILDQNGAETLLGRGDGLLSVGGTAPVRFQGALTDSETIDTIIEIAKET